jgi:hypothetical protein
MQCAQGAQEELQAVREQLEAARAGGAEVDTLRKSLEKADDDVKSLRWAWPCTLNPTHTWPYTLNFTQVAAVGVALHR